MAEAACFKRKLPDAVYEIEMTVIARYVKVVLAGEHRDPCVARRNLTP